jgi:hypothetical protein
MASCRRLCGGTQMPDHQEYQQYVQFLVIMQAILQTWVKLAEQAERREAIVTS